LFLQGGRELFSGSLNHIAHMVIPKATKYQGAWRLARKKTSLLSSLPVKNEIPIKTKKYTSIIDKINSGLIELELFFE